MVPPLDGHLFLAVMQVHQVALRARVGMSLMHLVVVGAEGPSLVGARAPSVPGGTHIVQSNHPAPRIRLAVAFQLLTLLAVLAERAVLLAVTL